MYNIKKFCEKRRVPKKIQDAFIAYCKASVSDYYQIGNGQTVTGILTSFNDAEIEKMWLEFVIELRSTLSEQ